MLNKLRLRLRALFFKSRLERELEDELSFHLEKEIEQNIARGLSPEEARLAALRSFGGVERVKEESRDERGVLSGLDPAFKSLTFDLQGGLKQGARGHTTTYQGAQRNLVVLQLALTMVLLVGAGLLFRTIRDLWAVNPGFDS